MTLDQNNRLKLVIDNNKKDVRVNTANYKYIFRAIAQSIPVVENHSQTIQQLIVKQGTEVSLSRVRNMLRNPDHKSSVNATGTEVCALIAGMVDTSNDTLFKVSIKLSYAKFLFELKHIIEHSGNVNGALKAINDHRESHYQMLEAGQ